jgi:hypothetical protein
MIAVSDYWVRSVPEFLEIRLKYLPWKVNWMTVGLEIVEVVCYSKYIRSTFLR